MNTTLHPTLPATARIDQYISQHMGVAMSDVYTQAKESGEAAIRHGFTGSANARYLDFLETFRDCPEFAADYQERYPACRFLPWRAFHLVRMQLRLHLDLPQFYAGAVPESQMPWLDAFGLEPGDVVAADELDYLVGSDISKTIEQKLEYEQAMSYSASFSSVFAGWPSATGIWEERQEREKQKLEANRKELRAKLSQVARDFRDSFFVLAPHDAFTTTQDFIKRAQNLEKEVVRYTQPPNDPLVVRFVKRGCLAVAAWGDEAAALNELTAKLRI